MVYDRLLQFLLPARCPACDGVSTSGFCAGCRADLNRVERPCGRCGLPLPAPACPRLRGGWLLDFTVAPLEYAEPLQSHIQALKFGGARHLGQALGELLANELRCSDAASGVDMLVAVPLHRSRFLARGYNQAVEIARPLATALDLHLGVAGIRRHRATAAQTRLAAAERQANLRDAFTVRRELGGLSIAIVDDVITTGATVNGLARELLRSGAASVRAWAVARSA